MGRRAMRRGPSVGRSFNPLTLSGARFYLDSALGITQATPTVSNASAFETASWVKNFCTITADNTTDPLGTSLADLVVEDTTTNAHRVGQNIANIFAGPAVISIDAKPNARSWIYITTNAGSAICWFDITNGTVGTQTGSTGSITSLGNGWYRCTMTVTYSSGSVIIGAATGNLNQSYLGTGASAVWLFNAQVTQPRVSAWADQVTSDGAAHDVSNATAANQPLYITSDTSFNNRPTARFDGSNDSLAAVTAADFTFLHDGVSGASLVFVARATNAATTKIFLDTSGDGTRPGVRIRTTNSGATLELDIYNAATAIVTASAAITANIAHCFVYTFNGTNYAMHVDGTSVMSGTASGAPSLLAPSQALALGRSTLTGEFARVWGGARVISAAEITSFTAASRTLYATP